MSHPFWFAIYNVVIIPVLFLGMWIARFFNSKISAGIHGRRGLFRRLEETRTQLDPYRRLIVLHCTSAGEFEAARPLLTRLRQRRPDLKVHVTCYSPSGMRSLSKAEEVESFSYLPFDSWFSARRFFRILRPVAFLIVKHDVWPNLVWAAARQNIPVLWINANLHAGTKRLKLFSRGLNKSFLGHLNEIWTVGEDHAQRLRQLVSPDRIVILGDSRYDRTLERLTQVNDSALEPLRPWIKDRKVLVGGSTWGPDQRLLIPVFARVKLDHPELRLVLVPHEPEPEFLADTELYLQGYQLTHWRYTHAAVAAGSPDVLIMDQVGLLASLYRLAWAAYVGGAFGEGVHSVLEPAAFQIPIFFGPRYYMANEAQQLLQCGGAWSVSSPADFEQRLRHLLEHPEAWQQAAAASGQLVQSNAGATDRIIDRLETRLPRAKNDL